MSSNENKSKALVVLCHPNKSGFNQAIAGAAVAWLEKTHSVTFLNLYEEPFDPVLPQPELPRKFSLDEIVQKYNRLVQEAQVLVFVHPDWWGGPPALLKGFVDRVFRPGVAYEFEGFEFLSKKKIALFAGKKAIVFTTTDYSAPPQGDVPSTVIWKQNVFGYCGINDAEVYTFYDTYNSTYEARHTWILDVGKKIERVVATPSPLTETSL